MQNYGDFIERLITDGYISAKGVPLRCQTCASDDLEDYGHIYENGFVIEHYVRCKSHEHLTGIWAYGTWDI